MINIYRDIIVFGYLNFYFELFFAVVGLVWRCERRTHFLWRFLGCQVCALAFYFLPSLNLGMGVSLSYLIVFAAMVAELLFLFRMDGFTALFYGVAAFAMQNMAWSALLLIFELIGLSHFNQATGILLYLGTYLLHYAVCFVSFGTKVPNGTSVKPNLTTLVIVTVTMFLVYLLSALISHGNLWNPYARLYSIMCCVIALCAQFGVFRNSHLQTENEKLARDNEITKELIYQEKKQRELTRDVIEIIDIKCHDLKHQISFLHTMDSAERKKQIGEIEQAVMLYGNIAKTGNYALDVVLTEKCLICENRKIKISYIADGDSLSFLDPVDTACLFGNILDNAIECAVREPEDRRVIRLNISTMHNCVSISCENYCGHVVTFSGELPVSDKSNKTEHGFGVKSIRYIVQQYGGNLVMKQEDDLFSVNIMLPMKMPD